MKSIEFLPARPEDVNCLAVLSIEVWLDTYALEGIPGSFAKHVLETYTPAAFALALADRDRRFLIARRGNALLGYALLRLNAEPVSQGCVTAEIETLYVRRHHQRLGLGRALFEGMLKLAAEAGQPKLFLTVYEGNHRTIAFYEALGMLREGRRTFEFEGGSAPNVIMTMATGA